MAVRARHPCSGCDVELEDCHRTSRGLALEPESDRQPPDPDLFAWSRQHESILPPRSFFREDASMAICPGPREIAYLSSPKPAEEILELPGPGLGRLPRTPLLETVWK